MDRIPTANNPPIAGWQRHARSPGWVKSLFLETEFHSGPRKTFEIAHCQVREAFTHFGIGEHEYFMSLLLRSGARKPLEVDFGCGRFYRHNHPGDIVFGGYQAGNCLKGVGPFHSIGMYFPKNIIKGQFEELTGEQMPDFSSLHSRVIRDQSLMLFMKQLLVECRRGASPGHTLVTDGLFNGILGRIATLGGLQLYEPGRRSKLPPAAITKSVEFMREHLGAPLGLDELAAAAGVHKGHYTRLFKLTFGETPMRYLTRIRIEKAKQMLHNRQDYQTIQQIARACGFPDNSHFSKEFKRHYGLPPSAFLS